MYELLSDRTVQRCRCRAPSAGQVHTKCPKSHFIEVFVTPLLVLKTIVLGVLNRPVNWFWSEIFVWADRVFEYYVGVNKTHLTGMNRKLHCVRPLTILIGDFISFSCVKHTECKDKSGRPIGVKMDSHARFREKNRRFAKNGVYFGPIWAVICQKRLFGQSKGS